MRKFELHLDALVTHIVIIVVAFGLILFQRYQYSDLLQENIDLKWERDNLLAEKVLKNALIAKCQKKSATTDAPAKASQKENNGVKE